MNIQKLLVPITLVLLFSCASVQAAPIAADEYRIDMTVSLNGSLIGKPAVVAKVGAEAEIRDENPMKPNDGFKILVTATALDAPSNGREAVKLKLVFFGRSQGKWIQRAEHTVSTVTGRSVSFAFPSEAPEAKGKDYDLVLTINRDSGNTKKRPFAK